jgi:hypothetical protein
MRRLALVGAVSVLVVLGFGAAYVLAGASSSKQSVHITICHSGSGKKFDEISPASVGVLLGHAKNDSDDIIPPFAVVEEDGKEVSFPGQNMDTIYGDGYTGAEVLANGCDVPGGPVITRTETSETTTTRVPVTVTTPTTTVTLPGGTTTTDIAVTVTVPGETTAAPGTTTVVTVPKDVTTTVTLPTRTTTLPAVTTTVAGQTIERPAETVTLPGTTVTVTAAATTTVVTVTGPNQVVHAALVTKKRFRTTIKTPKRVVHIAGRVMRLRGKAGVLGTRVVVVVSRPRTCPSETTLLHGKCSPVVRGKG